jgi:hypothetical protein
MRPVQRRSRTIRFKRRTVYARESEIRPRLIFVRSERCQKFLFGFLQFSLTKINLAECSMAPASEGSTSTALAAAL